MLILKFIWKYKGPKIDRIILKKENKMGRLTLPEISRQFKSYSNEGGITTRKDQWTREKNPETEPH